MIKRVIRQMLAAQILSALTVSLCLLIDNIMIGRFLGVEAIAAYGLANPVLLVTGALGSMLAAGIQVACSRSLGMGSQEETNRGFTAAIVFTGLLSLTGMALVLIFRSPLATLMGAGDSGALFDSTRGYLAGFVIGAPASMGALILVPFLQLAGQSGLLIAAVLGMTVTDIALDLVNVLVFHGGMFGMGLASSLSYYVAMVIGAFYFLSKKCVFRFSLRRFSWRKVGELLKGGVPTVFTMASTVILIFIMNKLLLSIATAAAVAAFSVVNTLGNAANCISTGTGGVSLTLSGILYNEEDRTGLRQTLGLLVRSALALGFAVGGLLCLFAPACVSLFIPDPGETQDMAVLATRVYAAGLVFCCVNNALKSCYQGTERIALTEAISFMEGAVLPSLVALAGSRLLGLNGAWLFFPVGEALALLGICALVWARAGRVSLRADDFLVLGPDFGVTPENLMERDIRNLADVTDASQSARRFCREHGQSERMGNRIGLCIEEMAANTVTHGFAADGRNHLSIRLQFKGDRWVLRFRDDCAAFDPVHWLSQDERGERNGLRLVSAMADEIRYIYSLNLNNLTIVLKGK